MTITTFTRIVAKDGHDLSDQSSPAGKAYKQTIDDALAQSTCRRVHYGREVEDGNNFWVFAEWDSVEDRLAYVKGEGFASVSKDLREFVSVEAIVAKHFYPSSSRTSPSALFATADLGTVEVLSLHFPADISDADQKTCDELWADFEQKGLDPSKDLRGVSGGWSVEADVPVLGGEEVGKTGKALVLLLGWSSVEAHHENRAQANFLAALPNIMEKMPGRNGINMVHIKPESR